NLEKELGISRILATLLAQQGIDSTEQAKKFFEPSMEEIHDPTLLHDMDKAVERIEQAVEKQEQITIYGDYDADGITSTSLMYETLLSIGANVNYYVPNRFTDGYGPNMDAYQRLIDNGTQLFITVDNGVSGKNVIDKVIAAGEIGRASCRERGETAVRAGAGEETREQPGQIIGECGKR